MIRKLIAMKMGLFICILFLNCSNKLIIKSDNSSDIVEKIFKKEKVDTVFSYHSSNLEFLWFHRDNKLHSYMIKDYKIKKYSPVTANFINVSEEDMNKYINGFEGSCFSNTELDGESISVHVKNKETVIIGFDLKCLTKTKFDINSFPYKIQYDFSKIFKPEGYSFEEMYKKR